MCFSTWCTSSMSDSISAGVRCHPLSLVLSQPKSPSRLLTISSFLDTENVGFTSYVFSGFFSIVYLTAYSTCVSYFHKSYRGAALRLAAPRLGLLQFGHRVYIVTSVFLTQTLLKHLLCLQGSEGGEFVSKTVSGISSVNVFAMYHIESGRSMDQMSLSINW